MIRPSGSMHKNDDPGMVWLRYTEADAELIRHGAVAPPPWRWGRFYDPELRHSVCWYGWVHLAAWIGAALGLVLGLALGALFS